MMMTPEQLEALTKGLVDRGLLIEAGWMGFRHACYPLGASEIQLEETRNAFFAGCTHLFSSMMSMLDPGSDETPADLRRMASISDELERFETEFKRKHGIPFKR